MVGSEAALERAFELTGQRILITGAAGGIGAMTARVCASLGAAVLLVDQRPTDALARELGETGANAAAYVCDVTKRDEVEAVAASAGTVDALVLVEEIDGPGPAVLEIHNGRTAHLDVSPATGFLTLSVVKIIANRGPWRWSGFDLELMIGPDQPSVYADGLSFDQPRTVPRQARADRFLQTAHEDEPFDRIRFDGGQVDPGQYLRLDFDLVDVNGTAVFYLVQRPITLLAWDLQPPSSRTLAALGRFAPVSLANCPFGERAVRVAIDTTRPLLTMLRSCSPALTALGGSSILPHGRSRWGDIWIFGSKANGRS